MRDPRRVAVIAGDGIGPEVVQAAIEVVDAAVAAAGEIGSIEWEHLPYGADHYLTTGETLPDELIEHLRSDVDATFLGALGDPRVPGNEHARDILLALRRSLDLYINFRPFVQLHADLSPLKRRSAREDRRIDFTIFRENTEGSYLGRGRSRHVGTPSEEQVVEEVHTAHGVSRLLTAAFEWARTTGKSRVTVADKSNAIEGHRLWRRLAEEIAPQFDVELEFFYVDALAMELIRDPYRFEVIATSNLFGDILSDLAAQLIGGLGVAPSANLHPGRAGLYEPVHGSAPALAGTGSANPIAAILTTSLLLENIGFPDPARRIRSAVSASIAAGVATPDIGGTASTTEVTSWLRDHTTREVVTRGAQRRDRR